MPSQATGTRPFSRVLVIINACSAATGSRGSTMERDECYRQHVVSLHAPGVRGQCKAKWHTWATILRVERGLRRCFFQLWWRGWGRGCGCRRAAGLLACAGCGPLDLYVSMCYPTFVAREAQLACTLPACRHVHFFQVTADSTAQHVNKRGAVPEMRLCD